jgi:hypothetical protein
LILIAARWAVGIVMLEARDTEISMDSISENGCQHDDHMQFALMCLADTKVIMSAHEHELLLQRNLVLADTPSITCFDELKTPCYTAYGVYIPQPDREIEAADDALEAIGSAVRLVEGSECHLCCFKSLFLGKPIYFGRALRIPVAMLIQSYANHLFEDLMHARSEPHSALVANLAYTALSPQENILNRRGLFAFDKCDVNLSGRVFQNEDVQSWPSQLDKLELLSAANRIW